MEFNDGRLWRIATWFPKLEADKVAKLKNYHSELIRFNAKLNLISSNTERQADQIHFADSILACQKILEQKPGATLYDFGSGNGFPGLVAAILDPKRKVTLVERDVKKGEFLKFMSQILSLPNVTVFNKPAEEVEEGTVQLAVSRAFAPIPKAILMLRGPFAIGGEYYHLKSDSWLNEVSSIPPQLCAIWSPKLFMEYELPDNGPQLCLILTKKITK